MTRRRRMLVNELDSEQARSLLSCFGVAEIEHGDLVDIELRRVGVKKSRTLCFCPSLVAVIRRIKKGSRRERKQPMPYDITASKPALTILQGMVTGHGFIEKMRVVVHANGTIHLSNIRDLVFRPAPEHVPVNRPDSYLAFCMRR